MSDDNDDGDEWEQELEAEAAGLDFEHDELEGFEELELEEVPVSAELERQLSSFVLIDNWELAVSRAETLDYLVDQLIDLEDEEEMEAWVEQYGDRDFHLSQERDGRIVITDVFPVSGVLGFIPRSIIHPVFAELVAQDQDLQEGWLETLSDLVGDWLLLLSDEEKMVGHLIRAHDLPIEAARGEHADLVATHAGLHAKA